MLSLSDFMKPYIFLGTHTTCLLKLNVKKFLLQFCITQKALKDLIGKLHFYYCQIGSVSIDLNSEQVVKCFACYLGSLSYKTSQVLQI